MPRHISVLLLLYLGVILVGFLRAVFDRTYIEDYPLKNLVSEELINTVKWVLPGILLFHGCRTRRRVLMALVCLLVMYGLIAIQVIRQVPYSSVLETGSTLITDRFEVQSMGYNADNASAILAGAFWGTVAVLPLISRKGHKVMVVAAIAMIALGQALSGGRAGYIAWGGIGLVLCLVKWRKQLLLAPLVVMLLPIVFPGAMDLMYHGIGLTDVAGQATNDRGAISSGRNLFWPLVTAKISESPIIGHGRLAMKRTGVKKATEEIWGEGEGIGHPHNMYLETLLDNGILGSMPIFLFWGMVVIYTTRLFRNSNRLFSAVGGLTLSLVLAQLFAGLGAQHFYPMPETFGMWMAIFLAMRVYVEEKRAQVDAISAECYWNEPALSRIKAPAYT